MRKNEAQCRLSDIVKREIGRRIAICLFIFFVWLMLSWVYEIYGLVGKVWQQLNNDSAEIANFIISQKLVSNPNAIKEYVNEYNQQHKDRYLRIYDTNLNYNSQKMNHVSIYKWEYIYPLKKLNGNFGYFVIYGSYLTDKGIIKDFLLRAELSFVFMLLILFAILPLAKSIPQKIFIVPIERLLKVINKEVEGEKSHNNNYYEPHEIKMLRNDISNLINKVEEKSKSDALLDIAKQVAHDIRSPLTAINTAIMDFSDMSEKKMVMIRNASRRINDIANNLLPQYRSKDKNFFEVQPDNFTSSELLFVAIESIISEKRYEYNHKNINISLKVSDKDRLSFSKINLVAFKRTLSNLINNSIEAIEHNGIINIYLHCDEEFNEIIIEDNGCGIPQEILKKVTENGFSYKKKNGSGLGLSYAKNQIENLSGKFSIDSQVGLGTKVKIQLLRSQPPNWFCDRINIGQKDVITILDNDNSIHDVWNAKLSEVIGITLINFLNSSDLKFSSNKKSDLYLIDYELNEGKNGLDLIQELAITGRSILVTSNFEESDIRLKCEKMGIKILPKAYVPYVPIFSKDQEKNPYLVFIDDDEMMRETWAFAAELSDKKNRISIFSSPEEFNKQLLDYDKKTLIYIDAELSDGIKGEEYAKELYEKGFSEIYLTTGHTPDTFNKMPWIKSIVSKDPPF